jgi:hypothetical protein
LRAYQFVFANVPAESLNNKTYQYKFENNSRK